MSKLPIKLTLIKDNSIKYKFSSRIYLIKTRMVPSIMTICLASNEAPKRPRSSPYHHQVRLKV